MPQNPPSLQTIAELAGVSAMTVSRALNGHAVVADATRMKIQKICERVGYVAQPQVSAAMRYVRQRGRGDYNGQLGFIHSFPNPNWRENGPTYFSIVDRMIARARQLGYGVEILHAMGKTGRHLDQILKNRGVRGVIVGMLPRSSGHLTLDWSRIAPVSLGYTLRRPVLHRVGSDISRGMQLICHKLRKLGYCRIAYVTSLGFEQRTSYLFSSGFAGWWAQHAPGTAPLIFMREPAEVRNFWQWFRRSRVDCVISPAAWPMESVLRDAGVDIPGEVGFASADVEALGHPVSGLDQRQREAGVVAVDKVVGLLSTGSFGVPASPILSLIESAWKSGPTTRKQTPAGE